MNESTLIHVIELQLGRRSVKMDDRFYEDLGAESIDMLHIVVEMESQSGIHIPEEVIPELFTVQDLYDFIITRKE